jgi:hypothetical protein
MLNALWGSCDAQSPLRQAIVRTLATIIKALGPDSALLQPAVVPVRPSPSIDLYLYISSFLTALLCRF